MKIVLQNEKLSSLKKKGKIKLVLNLYRKLKLKFRQNNILIKKNLFGRFCKNLENRYPILFDKISIDKFIKIYKSKIITKRKTNYKTTTINDNEFLSKRFRKLLVKFSGLTYYKNTKYRIKRRLSSMNRIISRKRMLRNVRKRSYYFRIIRKKRRHKLRAFRLNKTKPIFTKKSKKERKFLLKSRESLVKTKKFLYRKKFPKIKGKKNKNFNFFYYNNIERVPFKFHIGRIVITYLLNNTFINIHNSKKMLKVISAGKLKFKGPKRSTAYSRQIVARRAINFVARTKMNVLDVFLNSNYNRWYYFLFKEFSKPKVKPYVIRYLVISNSRAHGFIRDRKHRRK